MNNSSEHSLSPLQISESLSEEKKEITCNMSVEGSSILIAGPSLEIERKDNFVIGALLMFSATVLVTIAHTSEKYVFLGNPKVKSSDFLLFVGVYNLLLNMILCKIYKVDLSIISCRKHNSEDQKKILKARFALAGRVLCGTMNGLVSVYAISQLPLSKSVLIFSLNPICCAILGYFLLKENITKTTILCILGAVIGIYVLTLSKQEDGSSGTLSGYIAAIITIWMTGSVLVFSRYLNLYGAHYTVICMVLGLSNILQTVIISCFCSNFLNFSHYRLIDLLILNIHGMLSAVWIPLMFLAAKYAEASFISPILNIENVFTILIDMFVFGYTFISTDFIGMSILGTCIVIPILKNYFGRE
ncbi:unnamed protein product [Moneuplotes crassus]|uniref:EamA domain-containing protein n=1 Tax=Euplotes crassus TaxID=5936 RepID=A0AAD1XJM7_EUPCR|nr:unnamed protein product [Moneuplotes crassus]